MKKFLSLVLALVMAMSLVTISAGAKDFTDSADINYNEAVDVMSALEIIDGYRRHFQPQHMTRGAAAKIIATLILGPHHRRCSEARSHLHERSHLNVFAAKLLSARRRASSTVR
jgi:minor extracellular protease Epr